MQNALERVQRFHVKTWRKNAIISMRISLPARRILVERWKKKSPQSSFFSWPQYAQWPPYTESSTKRSEMLRASRKFVSLRSWNRRGHFLECKATLNNVDSTDSNAFVAGPAGVAKHLFVPLIGTLPAICGKFFTEDCLKLRFLHREISSMKFVGG